MDYEEFKKILKDNDLTLKEFAKLAKISYSTCNTWSKPNRKVSNWVNGFLNLYIEKKAIEKDLIKYKNFKRSYDELVGGTLVIR